MIDVKKEALENSSIGKVIGDVDANVKDGSDASTPVEKKKKQRKTRSTAGCFTCRLKRMKCDEKRPICSRCNRNMLTCIWPKEGNGRLTKEMRRSMKETIDPYAGMDPNKAHFVVAVEEDGKLQITTEDTERHSTGKSKTKVNFTGAGTSKDVKSLDKIVIKSPIVVHADSTDFKQVSPDKPGTASIDFVNYSYESKDKDFVKLERDKTTSTLSSSEEDSINDAFFSTLLENMPGAASDTRVVSRATANNLQQFNVIGSDPDFFWGKVFDMNFTKPLMTPNFNIISPLPSMATLPAADDTSMQPDSLLLSQFGEKDCYVLDNEQTGEIYLNLLQNFKDWSKLNDDDDDLLSIANILSKYAFTEKELLLYFTCVHYFFPAIGPQPTLPQLTTTETFLPLIKQHAVVKDVFLCCGATFLEWCQPSKYSDVAEELYQKSRTKLKQMTKEGTIKRDETWAFACFQLLCLTDKFRKGSGTSMTDRCVDNLAHSFNIIKKKIKLIQTQGSTATDRMLIESFMYNYTVSLLVARDLSKLPSPFSKNFYELTKILKSPLFDGCDVNWINNPILGSSVEAFEMLAKVSYLSRFPLPLRETEWIERGKRLLEECLYYTPPSLPDEVKNDPQKYATYRPSLLCGSIISKACYLLLSKILRFTEFKIDDFEIQGVVKYTIKSLCAVEKGNPLLCILLWSLLIIGAFTIDMEDRLVIKEYLRSASETIHTYGALKIADFLDLIWQQKNIDLLFVRENLSQVVI